MPVCSFLRPLHCPFSHRMGGQADSERVRVTFAARLGGHSHVPRSDSKSYDELADSIQWPEPGQDNTMWTVELYHIAPFACSTPGVAAVASSTCPVVVTPPNAEVRYVDHRTLNFSVMCSTGCPGGPRQPHLVEASDSTATPVRDEHIRLKPFIVDVFRFSTTQRPRRVPSSARSPYRGSSHLIHGMLRHRLHAVS